MNLKHTLLFFCLSFMSVGGFAGDDWSQNFYQWACGMSEGLALKSAAGKAATVAGQYQAQCEKSGGEFSWTYRNGFCTPYDPNSIGCPTECPVFARVYCRMPALEMGWEAILPHKPVILPGDLAQFVIDLKNVKDTTLTGVSGETSISQTGNAFALSSQYLAWDDIVPGATVRSTSPIEVKVAPNAVCGSSFGLKVDVKSATVAFSRQANFTVGKFNGAPVVVENAAASLAVDQMGKTVTLPITFPAASNTPNVRKVQLVFRAKLNANQYVRFTLTSPDATKSLVVSEGYAGGSFTYNQDLTAAFKEFGALGDWKLLAQVWGGGTLESYKLLIVPDSYNCGS
ncbi:MAG: hypothetical protein HYZ71_05065 [Deltaproteobacteria bacterium]|nr:hypothetical protein [Deltaproteobacteria bacterium]